jgi:uncharacterized protein Usg
VRKYLYGLIRFNFNRHQLMTSNSYTTPSQDISIQSLIDQGFIWASEFWERGVDGRRHFVVVMRRSKRGRHEYRDVDWEGVIN